MQSTAKLIQKLSDGLKVNSFKQPPAYDCEQCQDTGIQSTSDGVIRCECVYKRALDTKRKGLLDAIPAIYKDIELDFVDGISETQAKALSAIRKNPHGNFLLYGDVGAGKTYLLWALYKQCCTSKEVIPKACKLNSLLEQYMAQIGKSNKQQEQNTPLITVADLRQNHQRYAIFLDDIDKGSTTEFCVKTVYDILDAVMEYGHQLVCTTNLDATQLIDHFGFKEERFGEAIVRRLIQNTTVIELLNDGV